jgi:hypothetical protein
VSEELGELDVAQVEIEAGRICAHAVAPAAEQAMKGKARLLGSQIPQGDLDCFVEGQTEGALVASAWPADTMHKAERWLTLNGRPDLAREDAIDFVKGGKRKEQALNEAKPSLAAFVNEFESGNVNIVRPNLAVANDPVSRKLEAG